MYPTASCLEGSLFEYKLIFNVTLLFYFSGLIDIARSVIVIKRDDGKLVPAIPMDAERLYDYVQHREQHGKTVNLTDWYRFDNANVDSIDFVPQDNFPVREPYDKIIRCLGFRFDFNLFSR